MRLVPSHRGLFACFLLCLMLGTGIAAFLHPSALYAESNCRDNRDNDGDTFIDCRDPSCNGVLCDDGWDCTENDQCFFVSGVDFGCEGTNVDENCIDNDFCDGPERCRPNNPNRDQDGCIPAADPACGNDETDIGCNERDEECFEVDCTDGVDNDGDHTGIADGTDCNDIDGDCPCPSGSICGNDDQCHETNCSDGIDNDGDGDADCADTADCPDGTPCDDGWECTTGEECDSGACPQVGPGSGFRDDSLCVDNSFCDGEEECAPLNIAADPDTGCIPGADPCPAAGTGCSESRDECTEIACNDGINNDGDTGRDCNDEDGECPCPAGTFCDTSGVPTCVENDCTDGVDNDGMNGADCADPACDGEPCSDGVSCTVGDSCSGGSCDPGVTTGAVCNDGLFCNGIEFCNPITDCQPGTAQCTDDGEICNEDEDRCQEVDCNDGVNNDGDVGRDCNDGTGDCPCPPGSICSLVPFPPHCEETNCGDGQDNDGDTLIDCFDMDCAGDPCSDGIDCTDDSLATCFDPDGPGGAPPFCNGAIPQDSFCNDFDPCTGFERCRPTNPNAGPDGCFRGILVPCTDPPGQGCTFEPGGPAVCTEADCGDGVDNDGEGGIDCQDSDCICPDGTTCRASGACPETDCTNGLDDDGDGLIDCADRDCRNTPCDDGASCTTGDICQRDPNLPAGTGPRGCFGTRTNSLCNDNATCTRDRCNPADSGADPTTGCTNTPVPAGNVNHCSDGATCTTEICDPNDPNAVTGTGCVFTFNNAACDDSLFCTGTESCNPEAIGSEQGTGCVAGEEQCVGNPGMYCDEEANKCSEGCPGALGCTTDPDFCRDGVDNDGDGPADCADSDCPGATPEICDDQIDNDCNGLIDCLDTAACRIDADGDNHFAQPCGGDCDDSNPNVNPGRAEDCETPEDDDCDGRFNCADTFECQRDVDGDRQIGGPCGDDCDDSDPTVFLGAAEICTNGKDDDCDGLRDCADPDCANASCDDGVSCTTRDVCQNGSCRGTVDNSLCDDGVFCTVDQCLLGLGCVNDAEDNRCDDRLFCNGAEECNPNSGLADANGCVDGSDPCGSDETCDEVTNSCECVADPFEPDTVCSDAREVTVDGVLRSEEHTLCPAGDLDRFEFPVVQGIEYTFFTTGPVDTLGIITGTGCGAELARNNDCAFGDDNFCLQWSATFTGRAVLTVQSGAFADPVKPKIGSEAGSFQGDSLRGAAQGIAKPGTERFESEPEAQAAEGAYTLFMQASQTGCLPDAFEPNDGTCGGSTPITPTSTPQTENHSLCPAGDLDGWSFFGEAGATYRFSSLGGTDTKVQIRSNDCTVVVQKADDCAGDDNFCIEFTPVSSATYKVVVLGQNSAVTGDYQFRYEKLGGGSGCLEDTAEPDDGCSEAVFLSVGPGEQSASRSLCGEGDVDTFRFNALAGRIYRFETTGGTDTRVIVGPDDCGGVFADSTSCGPDAVNACVLWEAPADGAYKVRVQGRLSSVTGNYTLLYAQETCPADGWEPDGNCGNATNLVVDNVLRKQSHTICPGSEIDLWKFFAQAGVTYHFFSEGPTDMGGAVLNGNCQTFLVKDESSGTGENFDLRFTPTESGMYSFGVTGDGGPYDLFYQAVSDPGTACVEDGAEDDDVCAQATPIVPSLAEQTMVRTLCPTDDRDHFQFQAVAGVTYRLWTEGDVDTVGTVRGGPSCTQLQRNDDCNLPDNLNFCMDWTAPETGTAFVRIQGFSPGATVGDYTFHFQIAP